MPGRGPQRACSSSAPGGQRVRGDPRTVAIEQQQAVPRGDEQPAAVRRPGELADARHRGAPPQPPPRVDRGDHDAPVPVGERQHVARVGAPGRRHAAVGGAVAPVARPVAVDHPQGAAGEVRDAEAVDGRPAGAVTGSRERASDHRTRPRGSSAASS